tara:strand:+ start:526 stop:1224 length:699 start_codon:yes stop_codon:yes gene_type:complete
MEIKNTDNQNNRTSDHIYKFLKYNFKNFKLLNQSLTHSLKQSDPLIGNNQRLEFLGDRVLAIIIAKLIFIEFPNENEGQLSKRFSELVSKRILVKISKSIKLDKLIQMKNLTIKPQYTESMLADTMEALICAIFLDSDLNEAEKIVKNLWLPEIKLQIHPPDNPKSKLQEWCLGNKIEIPDYIIVDKEGPDHKPEFTVRLTLNKHLSHTAKGKSIQEAEIKVARNILKRLND